MKITERCYIVFIVGERTTINILLLGETGTGKSTWINGFANYVRFDTLSDAEAAGGSFPISSNFIVDDPVTYEERTISTDKHVRHSQYAAGEPVTQEPKTYCFTHGDLTINLIDTPGLSDRIDTDTGKHEQDKQHVDDILHFIGRFDKLHAICILLKPNQTRITEGFAYCITEILRNLHESACNNVIFIMPNTRSTCFKPGHTVPTLRDFFRHNSLTKVKLNQDTIYCFENDTVQHIVEYINECPHDEDEHLMAEESWKKNSEATIKMLKYIQGCAPHDVDNTQCIYNTRCLIRILSKVLFEIVKCTTTNSEHLASKREEIKKRQSEIQKSPSEYHNKNIDKILSSDDALRHLKDHCDKIESYVAQSKKERDKMLEVGALLSVFLQTNVLFNPSSSDLLGFCLINERDAASEVQMQKINQRAQLGKIAKDEEQRKIVAAVDADISALSKHKESISDLIERYEGYYETTSSSGRVITVADAHSMVDDLYKLPLNGKTLKESVTNINKWQKMKMQHDKCETAVNIPVISTAWRTFVSKFTGT